MLKLRDVLSRWKATELSQTEAAGLLGGAGQRFRQVKPGGMACGGMSERTFRRWARRFEDEGEEASSTGISGAARAARSPVQHARRSSGFIASPTKASRPSISTHMPNSMAVLLHGPRLREE